MHKIAIIIPARGNPDVTQRCLDTFLKYHSNPIGYTWKIFHADTGSSQSDISTLTKYTDEHFDQNMFQLIEYDWYNFAKINNDVAFNHIDNSFTHYLFCNNDVEFTCNVLDRSIELYDKNPDKIGTIGYRLLYPNHQIQHDGQMVKLKYEKTHDNDYPYLHIGHENLRKHAETIEYNTIRKVIGNTFACVLTESSLYKKIGGLSENYCECFEDVQYNLECVDNNRVNICLESKYSIIHYESLTRNENPGKLEREKQDYRQLMEFWFRDRGVHNV
jgi:O-antigen biosynthesis protein